MGSDLKWAAFSIQTNSDASDAICEMLLELGAGGVSVLDPSDMRQILSDPNSLTFADDAFIESLGSEVEIKAYFPVVGSSILTAEKNNEADLINDICMLYSKIPGIPRLIDDVKRQIEDGISRISEFLAVDPALVTCELVCAEDWADNWKKDYTSFRLSERVIVSPSWEKMDNEPGEKVILLDPGSAFGTGTHETTAMCAGIIDRAIEPGERVLDLGCGSGILSILADTLGAEYVEAIDIDRTAVDVASDNIRANNAQVNVHTGVLTDASRNDFTLIVANIIADVLIDISPDLKTYLVSSGRLLISGIIDHRSKEVLDTYQKHGYILIEAVRKGDWHAFFFRLC